MPAGSQWWKRICLSLTNAIAPPSGKPVDEPDERLEHRLRLVAVRRVPAVGEADQLDVGREPRDPLDLVHRPVLVVLALDREDRAADLAHERLDVPRAEVGVEPDVVP